MTRVIGNRDLKKLIFPLALFGVISGSAAAGALGAFKHTKPQPAITTAVVPVSALPAVTAGRPTPLAIASFGPISADDGVAVARAAALAALDARLQILNSRELLALCVAVGSARCGDMDRAGVIKLIRSYAESLRRRELVAMCVGVGGCGAIPVDTRIRVMRYQTPTFRNVLAERETRGNGQAPFSLPHAWRQDATTAVETR